MKVLNYTTSYLAVVLLLLITIWASIFYYAMLDEIYDSIDDGLDNQKGLIIQKAAFDSTVLNRQQFDEGDYAIQPINQQQAMQFKEQYLDTLMYMQNEEDYEPVRMLKTVFRHGNHYYQMQIITSMVEEDDLIAELFYALLWLYGGLLISILLVNNLLLKRIWKPFYHLLKQLAGFRLEKEANITVQKTSIDEFKLLQQTVQQLLQHNIDTYISQKHFIENASHELQTPLAISINKLEALAESPALQEKDLELLGSALQNLERLTRLNKSMLLLSRIENKQYGTTAPVDINALVAKAADDWADQLAYNNISFNIAAPEKLTVAMNPDLAAILVANLVKNSIVHNSKDGFVNIIISKQTLVVQNSGGTAPLDEKKLFTRFNGGTSGASTGLGLAIVKAIADLYHFRISYAYAQKHVFTISFK